MQAGLDLDPLNTAGRFLLALVLYRSGLDSEAAEELRRLLFLEGDFALGHYYLGLVAQRTGDVETAIRSFRNAMKAQTDAIVSLDGSLLPLDAIQNETLAAASRARILSLELPVDVNGRLR
jgi:tetratricopeptide (TPR) repeat protein